MLNGYMIMLGSLGAVTATAPAEHLLAWMGWRQLFEILAAATCGTAVLIYSSFLNGPSPHRQHQSPLP